MLLVELHISIASTMVRISNSVLAVWLVYGYLVTLSAGQNTVCDSSPCDNGGNCTHTITNTYICQCVGEFVGDHCQYKPWAVWSPIPVVTVIKGTTAKLVCQYKDVSNVHQLELTWFLLQGQTLETVWSYSNSKAVVSSNFRNKIESNGTNTLKTHHTLFYLNASEDINFECHVKYQNTSFGEATTAVVAIEDAPRPEYWPVSSQPNTEAELGSYVQLRCDYQKVESTSSLTVVWYYITDFYPNGQPVYDNKIWNAFRGQPGGATSCSQCQYVDTGTPLAYSHSIRINNVDLMREGLYACAVSLFVTVNVAGNETQMQKQGIATTNVSILVPPSPIVNITIPSSGLYANDKITVNCSAPSVKPSVNVSMWVQVGGSKHYGELSIKDNGDNTSEMSIATNVLVTEEDDGHSVICMAGWRNMGYNSDTVVLDIKYPPTTIAIYANPSLPIKENSTVAVSCDAVGGNPHPDVEIVRRMDNANHMLGSSPLSIVMNREHDGSQLYCNATGGGIKTGHMLSNLLNIYVYYPATFIDIQGDLENLHESNTLHMNCSADGGNPANHTYSWRFVPRHGGEKRDIGEEDRMLIIPNITYKHAGNYICRASNDGGIASATQIVNINYSPHIIEADFQQSVYADLDQKVQLNVSFWAHPGRASVTWLSPALGNVTSTSQDLGDDRQLAVLKLAKVNASSFGVYKCVLDNGVGNLAVEIELKQLSKPDKPSSASTEKETAYSSWFLWKAGSNGGSPQTFTVSVIQDGEIMPYEENIPDPGQDNQVSILVEGLTPDTTYSLQVVSVNKIGQSESLLHPFKTRALPPDPTKIRVIQTADSASHDISWDFLAGDFDSVMLVQCHMDSGVCTNHTVVRDKTHLVVAADPTVTYTYRLVLYQHDVKVAESEEVKQIPDKSSTDPNIAVIAGGAGGGVAVIIIIIVVVVLVVMMKRRKSKPTEKQPINESPSTSVSGHGADFAVYAGVDKPKNTNPKPRVIQEGDPLYDVGPAVPAKDPALQAEIQQGAAASNGVSSNGVASDALNHENETTDNEKNKKKEKKGRKEKKEKKQKEVKAPAQYYNTKDPAPHKHDGGYSVVPAPSGEESAYAVAVSGSVLPPRAPRHKQDGIYAEVAPSRQAGRGPRPIIGDPNKSDYGIVNFDRKQPIEDPNDSD